ncbi:MAG: DUF192 domain-containing protein [Vulcanimicrobiaceae bacterium]
MIAFVALMLALARTIMVQAPNEKITLEVADTEASREYGLMFRTQLAPHGGMIFVFSYDERQGFWMKNTMIPLDMLFVRANGTIDSIAANVPAQSAQTPGEEIRREGFGRYVIELAAGEARRAGLHRGLKLILPKMEPHDSGAS